uniref:Uncharacterized protein n=1 Tax=Arundo donax TaxID=35708 RepID=A0A0A9FRQ4_ARUDO
MSWCSNNKCNIFSLQYLLSTLGIKKISVKIPTYIINLQL